MSDSIDAVEHQKHATAIAELKSETTGLKEGLTEVKGGLRDLSSDMKTILSAVQSNAGNKSPISMGAALGLFLTFCIGGMTLVILPMQQETDKRRLEQDEESRLHAANLKAAEVRLYVHAVDAASTNGQQDGKIDCIQTQLDAVDNKGPRGATK